jgi:RNA polymerase sigma-70 factor (ECF subfamily)
VTDPEDTAVPDQHDQALIARAQRGDRRAFGALATGYRDAVYGFARRTLGDREQAADACQDTLIRAWTRLDSFDAARPFRPWLFTIAANVCTDMLRRRRAPTVSLDDPDAGCEPGSPRAGPADEVASRQTEERIARGLFELNEEQRIAVTLKHIEAFSYEEIAEMTGRPVNTVKSHVHRGRRRLAEILGGPTEDAR